jgi:ATP-dependent helicase/nuclease subunit B
MVAAMLDRVFLGWDRPFSKLAVAWLLERRDELPGMLLVVPTAQSGRRLREALAESGGAVLSPKVVTPGSFLQGRDGEAAADWIERLAWTEVLENVGDWAEYEALFPEPPDQGSDWANGMAREMVGLRHSLQENGLLLSSAARKLRETVEAERWEALGRLENLVERKIQSWGMKSRNRILSEGLDVPSDITSIVLAGVAEMPPLVERALVAWSGKTTAVIGAPESEAAGFSTIGKPLIEWSTRALPWPSGSTQVVADPRQQAVEALRLVAEAQTPSSEVALGSADTEAGDELARAFTRAGWPAFHPAATMVNSGLAKWFTVWRSWLTDPTLACLADLLSLPETGILVGGKRAQKAKRLAELRDERMVMRTDDLQRMIDADRFRSDGARDSATELLTAAHAMEKWRGSFLGGNFVGTMEHLLEILGKTGSGDTAETMMEWLHAAAPLMERVERGAGYWIELMVSTLPSPAPLPPDGRVIDVQGWLELFHEPGSHLILCGMNEGMVPARSGGEPWLGEASRERLGLIKDADRAARDAYHFMSMLEARRDGGRVDVICGKSGAGGETLLPSRLLLASDRKDLPERVKLLFREVELPEAGMRWHADWKWTPRAADPPARLNVTSLGDYLACPFRYYLKHVVRMRSAEPERAEWNARDFGTVAHEVLERWGRDTEAREFEKTEAIHAWLSAELDRVVAEWFGKRVPLAIRIQTESLRNRLLWLSRVQAVNRVEGWEVIDVERKVELPVGDANMIDRVDRHRETGKLRVLDYKTGNVDSVDKAHRKKLGLTSALPAHLNLDCPAVYEGEEKGKTVNFLWHNLQLPLYASALVTRGEALPTPCYFTLRSTAAEVAIHEWTDFEAADLDAARACADWIASQIAAKTFWPPAEKVTYDDFAVLAAGRAFDEMFSEPGQAG